MQPYPRQEPVVKKVISALLKKGQAFMVMATGLGKTPVSAFIAQNINPKNILVLCHQVNILEQTDEKVFSKIFPDHSVTHFRTSRKKRSLHGRIVYATFQSLINYYDQIDQEMFEMIIVDESHHSRAYTHEEILSYFKPQYLLGMTATKDRMDGLLVEAIFGEPVVNISLKKAIEEAWLTPFEYFLVSDAINNEIIKQMLDELNTGVRLTKKDINSRIFIESRDKEIAQKIISHKKKSIVFCRNRKHAEKMGALLSGSKVYHSGNTRSQNDEILRDFRENAITCICCVNMLNEGVDVPDIELIAFVRSTQSKVIFTQQLGRSLRKKDGKEYITVLDFVGTVDRLKLLTDLMPHSKDQSDSMIQNDMRPSSFEVSGDGYSFRFDETIVDMMQILDRINTEFYETWQEASKAAIALGIQNTDEYKKRYREDPRLPSSPNQVYSDYPGSNIFLRMKYETWQEASKAAIVLGIKTFVEYGERHKEDPRLPSSPYKFYSDFPGLRTFLRMNYETWQEASKATIALGIGSYAEYVNRYKEDPRLPSTLSSSYSDYPGFTVFLGNEGKYGTWQEASKAAIALGIQNTAEYKKRYKEDPRLLQKPNCRYLDFPGFTVFLGGEKKDFYVTWQEASKATIALGIKTLAEYRKWYKGDPRLPAGPNSCYPDFPGAAVFFGGENNYETWQEASKATIALGIGSYAEYVNRYKEDPRLPSTLSSSYSDYPGFIVFLGGEKKDFYETWQEASKAVIALGIRNRQDYRKRYREDPRLPSDPNCFYPDFSGFKKFLKKK